MGTTVAAIYERGALYLRSPIQLPDATEVQVQIVTPAINAKTNSPVDSFLPHLTHIHHLLDAVELNWVSDLTRTLFPQLLQTNLHTLWHLVQPPRRTLCTLLLLSAGHLQPDNLTHEQIAAIRFTLDRLVAPTFSEVDIDQSREHLISAGLPSSFAFPPAMIQSYLDES